MTRLTPDQQLVERVLATLGGNVRDLAEMTWRTK